MGEGRDEGKCAQTFNCSEYLLRPVFITFHNFVLPTAIARGHPNLTKEPQAKFNQIISFASSSLYG
ncbi:hypothetical protein Cflav_PD5919 [Pedosphaera parvula Ellin514]|uniref:Uncharacterized protein n=1 Tax=Pedosphaera parvula (strain Ellin514) TaxID=320771 RepID=B9X9P0_PEDPL|nr:hypothetical protein Cflav_PD5919 [Pedosphaera parvula Ellin514]